MKKTDSVTCLCLQNIQRNGIAKYYKGNLLSADLFEENQRSDYIAFVKGGIDDSQLKEIRNSIKTGRPLSSNMCLKEIESKLARRLRAQPIGRPRKVVQF